MPHQIQLQWVNQMRLADQGQATLPLPITIGRAESNDVVLADRRAGVSRWHARVVRERGQLLLIDQHSTNGIFVGETRITRTPLQSGTTFRIGAFDLTLTLQHRCSNSACERLVDSQQQMCPWCGRFMAEAITRDGLFQ